jgi:hypothetical protein
MYNFIIPPDGFVYSDDEISNIIHSFYASYHKMINKCDSDYDYETADSNTPNSNEFEQSTHHFTEFYMPEICKCETMSPVYDLPTESIDCDFSCLWYRYYDNDSQKYKYGFNIPLDIYPRVRIKPQTEDEKKQMWQSLFYIFLDRYTSTGEIWYSRDSDDVNFKFVLKILQNLTADSEGVKSKLHEMIFDNEFDVSWYQDLRISVYDCLKKSDYDMFSLGIEILDYYDQDDLPPELIKRAKELVYAEYPNISFETFYKYFGESAEYQFLRMVHYMNYNTNDNENITPDDAATRQNTEDIFFNNNDLFGIMTVNPTEKDILWENLLIYLSDNKKSCGSLCRKFLENLLVLSDNAEKKYFADKIPKEVKKLGCEYCTTCCADCIHALIEDITVNQKEYYENKKEILEVRDEY